MVSVNVMTAARNIGILFCVGLMLEGAWPDALRRYFPLYWYASIFYCFSLGNTITFFNAHGSIFDLMLFVGSFALLALLVDSTMFVVSALLSISLSWLGWKLLLGFAPWHNFDQSMAGGFGFLFLLTLGSFLFGRAREQHLQQRMLWNRTASGILGHDVRNVVNMFGGAGHIMTQMFGQDKVTKNAKGERGYWIPETQGAFFSEYAPKMVERSQDVGEEIGELSSFLEGQVAGMFEQKEVSMRAAAEAAIHRLEEKMFDVKVTIAGKKDFTPQVVSGVFPNVFANLIANAVNHGKASEVVVTIDASVRHRTRQRQRHPRRHLAAHL